MPCYYTNCTINKDEPEEDLANKKIGCQKFRSNLTQIETSFITIKTIRREIGKHIIANCLQEINNKVALNDINMPISSIKLKHKK